MPTYTNGDNDFIRGGMGTAAPPPDPDPEPGINQSTDPQTGVLPRYRVAPYYMIDPVTNRPILGARGQGFNHDIRGDFVPVSGSKMPVFNYLGGFRLPTDTFGSSNLVATKFGFSVQNGICWITGNRTIDRSIGAFNVPALEFNPDDAMATISQPFFSLGETRQRHLTGVFHDLDTDWLITSCRAFYDGDQDATHFIRICRPDGSEIQPWYNIWENNAPEINPGASVGQVVKAPDWVIPRLGSRLYMHPEHWLNIINSLCVGPGLASYNPQLPDSNQSVGINPIMYYPRLRTYGQHDSGTIEWDDVEQRWYPRQRQCSPLAGRLTKQEISFFYQPTNSYISIGVAAGLTTGIWYGPRGSINDPPGLTHTKKGNHTGLPDEMPQGRDSNGFAITPGTSNNEEYANYYQLHDLDEIFNAENGWDPEPLEWGHLNPLLPVNPGEIVGGFFDTDTNRLYLVTYGPRVSVYAVI